MYSSRLWMGFSSPSAFTRVALPVTSAAGHMPPFGGRAPATLRRAPRRVWCRGPRPGSAARYSHAPAAGHPFGGFAGTLSRSARCCEPSSSSTSFDTGSRKSTSIRPSSENGIGNPSFTRIRSRVSDRLCRRRKQECFARTARPLRTLRAGRNLACNLREEFGERLVHAIAQQAPHACPVLVLPAFVGGQRDAGRPAGCGAGGEGDRVAGRS